jgi:hypothetical protein
MRHDPTHQIATRNLGAPDESDIGCRLNLPWMNSYSKENRFRRFDGHRSGSHGCIMMLVLTVRLSEFGKSLNEPEPEPGTMGDKKNLRKITGFMINGRQIVCETRGWI